MNRFDEFDGFAAIDRNGPTPRGTTGTSAVTELALAPPPWDRPSRSFESLTVREPEEEPDLMKSVHARRNELLYQLSIATEPEVRRSIEARLEQEERALAANFRAETHEPAKKAMAKVLGDSDDLIRRLKKL